MQHCPRCPFRHEINPFKSHQRSIAMMAMMVMSPKVERFEIFGSFLSSETSTFYCRAHPTIRGGIFIDPEFQDSPSEAEEK